MIDSLTSPPPAGIPMDASGLRFLVLGSNSFSGATFVAHVLKQGGHVVGMSRSHEPSAVFLPYKWGDHSRFTFYPYDLNLHLDAIMDVVHQFKPEYVVNFAAQSMVPQSWQNPEHWFTTNVLSMVRLHERLRACSFMKKYVNISTPEVYGSTGGVIKEDKPYNPSTPYAVSKAACDMSLMSYVKAYDFPAVFTRAANVCGPGQQLYRIIPRAVYCVLSGEKLRLEGGGTSTRSFIDMRDVSEGTLRTALLAEPGSIYHLSTDRRVSIRQLVEMICTVMNASFDAHVEVAEARLGLDAEYSLDFTRAQTELGWAPLIELEQIIGDTAEWMRRNWEEIRQQPRSYIHKP